MKYSFHFRAKRGDKDISLAAGANTLEEALAKVKSLFKAGVYNLSEVIQMRESTDNYYFNFRSLYKEESEIEDMVTVYLSGDDFAEVNKRAKLFFGDLKYKLDSFGELGQKSIPNFDLYVPESETDNFGSMAATLYANTEEEAIASANSIFPANYMVTSASFPREPDIK